MPNWISWWNARPWLVWIEFFAWSIKDDRCYRDSVERTSPHAPFYQKGNPNLKWWTHHRGPATTTVGITASRSIVPVPPCAILLLPVRMPAVLKSNPPLVPTSRPLRLFHLRLPSQFMFREQQLPYSALFFCFAMCFIFLSRLGNLSLLTGRKLTDRGAFMIWGRSETQHKV
jgi:hypothetical protein